MSYDLVEVLKAFSSENSITFPLLSDSNSKAIDGFKVRNKGATKGRTTGIPRPVVVLFESEGIVTSNLSLEGYTKQPPADEIITAVQRK